MWSGQMRPVTVFVSSGPEPNGSPIMLPLVINFSLQCLAIFGTLGYPAPGKRSALLGYFVTINGRN
jgi:hypothetical protein